MTLFERLQHVSQHALKHSITANNLSQLDLFDSNGLMENKMLANTTTIRTTLVHHPISMRSNLLASHLQKSELCPAYDNRLSPITLDQLLHQLNNGLSMCSSTISIKSIIRIPPISRNRMSREICSTASKFVSYTVCSKSIDPVIFACIHVNHSRASRMVDINITAIA